MKDNREYLDRVLLILFFLLSLVYIRPSYANDLEITHLFDITKSDIRLLVYKDGALGFMGHNHVIRVAEIDGVIRGNLSDLTKSTFTAKIPVKRLVVDNLEDRKRSGEEFENEIDDESTIATRDNLLGDEVLYADKYPWIVIHGQLKNVENKKYLELVIKIKEIEKIYSVPADIVAIRKY